MKKTIENYRNDKEKLLSSLEDYVRSCIKRVTENEYASKYLPFFGDGLANPEIWFNSSYRPLFIMKEVNIGLKSASNDDLKFDLEAYNYKWGIGPKRYYLEFVEDKFSDIYIGKYETWKRVARLSVGLENDFATNEHLDLSFNASYGQPVTLEMLNSVFGNSKKDEIPPAFYEKRSKYKYTTGNKDYIEAVNHIAVINIKKIGAGDRVESFVSQSGLDYIWHLKNTSSFLKEQIKLLNPTVIVCCCGPDNYMIKEELYKGNVDIRWINSYHPGNSYMSYVDLYKKLHE